MGAAYATLISYAVAGYFAFAFMDKSKTVFIMMTRSLFLVGIMDQARNRIKGKEL